MPVPVRVEASAAGKHRAARRAERGGSKLNLLLTLLILGAMGISAVKIVPPYVENYQLQDAMNTEAEFALSGYPRKSNDDVRQDIMKKVQDLGIPADPQNLQVEMSNGEVNISLAYSVPINLYVYQFTLQFHPQSDNHTI